MKTSTKIVVSALVALAVVMGAWIYFSGHQKVGGTVSPAGATFGTARIAMGVINGTFSATGSNVILSLYNSDATDRVISSVDGYLYGPFASMTVYMATSTSATATTTSSYIVNDVFATTANYYLSTTSPRLVVNGGTTADQYRIWPAGTYLDFMLGTTSTTTGMLGVKFLAQ